MTRATYLIEKLKNYGCNHVFGIPGTSCADFFFALDKDPQVKYVMTSNELEAGFMADGYGRFGRLGAICVSYGVGTLSLVNAIASAFTEKVPLIILNGGPTDNDKKALEELGVLFTHSTGKSTTDLDIFSHITVDALVWDRNMPARRIDELFRQAIERVGPVYLEVPSDLWNSNIEPEEVAERNLHHDAFLNKSAAIS